MIDNLTRLVNRWVMTGPRRQQILDAAFDTFLRYGYRRTTMDDIAKHVGLSRPTLYLTFPSKEAVFRAVVEVGYERIFDDIAVALPAARSLTEQLEVVLEIWGVRPFDLVTRAPAAEELMSDTFDFAGDLFRGATERLTVLLVDIIRAGVTGPDRLHPSVQDRARVLVAAVHGFKSTARDTAGMRRLVRDLVAMVVAGLPLRTAG
jgi:AcrR family transcriptional regulator